MHGRLLAGLGVELGDRIHGRLLIEGAVLSGSSKVVEGACSAAAASWSDLG